MTNLIKMERYHLLHNRFYLGALAGIFLLGFAMAESYVPELMGPLEKEAESLADIFNGMVYDSTFLLILITSFFSYLLGQEFSWRTIDQEVSAGHARLEIYLCKLLVYLAAFNLMALLFPIGGCVREVLSFGLGEGTMFVCTVLKTVFYSLLNNSAVFLVAVVCCCLFRNTIKAVIAGAGITFVLALYLGYGQMLGLPVSFLPMYQIRESILTQGLVVPSSMVVAVVWQCVLILLSWRIFHRCDLQ